MIRSSRSEWLSGIGAVVFIGGLVLANVGSGVTPTEAADWKKNLPSANRFTTPFTGAVLDKNTGLVWEQEPDGQLRQWFGALFHCVNRTVGGTVGWRLPSVVELNSVRDPSLPAPFVPDTVFTGVQSALYWSATTDAEDSTRAWVVPFGGSDVNTSNKTFTRHAWCVRGPMNADAY